MNERFTEEELAIAKSVDLTAVASYLGYTVKKLVIITLLRKWIPYESMIRATGSDGQDNMIRVRMEVHR